MRLTILAGALAIGVLSLPAAAGEIPSRVLDGTAASYAKWKAYKGDRGRHLGWVRGKHKGWAKHHARRVYYRYD